MLLVRGNVKALRRGAIIGYPQSNIPIVTVLSLFIAAPVCVGTTVSIPTLDQMAGDWIKAANVLNPPAMDNGRDMIQVRYDLISTRFNPGSTMMPQTVSGVPLPVLRLDGQEYSAQEMRWAVYELRRRNLNCNGIQVETAVRMIPEEQGFLTRITLRNSSNKARHVLVELQIPENTIEKEKSAGQAPIAINCTFRRGWISIFEPVQKPDRSSHRPNSVTWSWQVSLPSGGSYTLEYVVASDRVEEAKLVTKTHLWADTFSKLFDNCKHHWEQRWTEAFTPGNGHFSGSLPVFETSDNALRRIYYMSVLTVLSCERSQFRISPRDFLTETDRPGKQYFWDASMMSTVWALLEPQGMKASLRKWLAADLLHSHGINIDNGKDLNGWYAFSGANVFYTTVTYIKITGDWHFLDEVLKPCQKTVLSRLDEIAMLWKQRVKRRWTLADWGTPNNLLESGDPSYVGAVASLNAQSVGMMREMADLYVFKGNVERAKQLRDESDKLLPAVLGLYKPREGVWDSILENGTRAEQRHVVDFIYVSQAILPDLTSAMHREMLGFVKRELIMENWLRAMSLKDPEARKSTRPDHGPMGSYDGWIPLTVAEMCRLGDWHDAVAFLRRTAIATREGPYAQAHEFCGPTRTTYAAPICVATGPTIPPFEQWTPSRGQSSGGYSSKECIAGGAFADVIIGTLFGFQPDWQGDMFINSHSPRPFVGRLRNLRFRNKLYNVSAGNGGVAME
jgi:hypothetical protein